MREEFTAKRIAGLRNKKGVTALAMSLALGQGESYISKIENGHGQPSVQGLYAIIDYLGVSPMEFYDEGNENPAKIQRIVENLKKLDEKDLSHVDGVVESMVRQK
jgi:transcriptional regulator with XRE-family HTH domain